MKIKYNLEYNYFEFYNEAQGIVNFKKNVYKNEYKPIKSYTSNGLYLVKITIIIFFLMLICMLIKRHGLITQIVSFLFAASFAITFIFYILFLTFYNSEKNRCHRGELTLNKNGILDTSDDGIRIGLPWHLIEALIITDKVLCFTSKTMTCFFIESSHVEDILEAVKTYQKDLKIIDKRLHRTIKIDEEADKKAKVIETKAKEEVAEVEKSEEVKEDKKENQESTLKKNDNQTKEVLEEVKEEIKKEFEEKDTEVEDKIKELEGN